MAKCKHCKATLTHLTSEATATTGCSLDKDGEISLDEDLNSNYETNEWRCPECAEVIAWSDDEGREFLNNN